MGADRHRRTLLASSLAAVVLLSGCSGSEATGQEASAAATTAEATTAATQPAEPEPTYHDDEGYPCGLTNHSDGHQVIRYCGDATARITLGDSTAHVDGGTCEHRGEFLLINVGINYSAEANAEGSYLGLLMAPANTEGSYDKISMLELTTDGQRVKIAKADARLTTSGRRITGSITGRTSNQRPFDIELDCRTSPQK